MRAQAIPPFEFGPFRLDSDNRQLLRDGKPVALTPKVFDVLLFLVEHHGTLVLKDDLLKALWPDTFVGESNLTQAVFTLRKALGESGSDRHYIETIPRRGYRFTADVRRVRTAEGPPAVSAAPTSRSRVLAMASVAAVVVAVAAFQAFHASSPGAQAHPPPAIPVVAVMPFDNLTGDAGQEYFSDGLTEEMIYQLGHVDPQRLAVIARASVMRYKHTPRPWDQVERDLHAQYVLEGSVRRDPQRVRITAELIRMSDRTRVWAREYDRELISLLALQAAIAQDVAREIRPTLTGSDAAPSTQARPLATSVSQAYDLYLKGRYFWNKRTREGFEEAIDSFQQAIALDPKFARAYAGLADSYALMASYSLGLEFVPKARAAAGRALELDEQLAEAHTSLALIVQNHDWDWEKAEREYRRAIELDPNYATAHHWYAEFLAIQGRFDEALASSERARQLDPLSLIIGADRGVIFSLARQYDRAIEQFRAVQAVEPNFGRAHMIIGAYAEKGMFAEALAEIERWRRYEDSYWIPSAEAYVYRRAGRLAEARRALKTLEEACRRSGIDPTPFLGGGYIGIDNTKALAYMEKSYADHSNALMGLKVDAQVDPLRGDPRFQDLLRRMHFAP